MDFAILRASGTPRVRIPTRATSSIDGAFENFVRDTRYGATMRLASKYTGTTTNSTLQGRVAGRLYHHGWSLRSRGARSAAGSGASADLSSRFEAFITGDATMTALRTMSDGCNHRDASRSDACARCSPLV
jgi:hypothetical protein